MGARPECRARWLPGMAVDAEMDYGRAGTPDASRLAYHVRDPLNAAGT
jgi:hypothetical protein